ncbi:MAG: hypothetical protein ACK4P3_09155 [Fimbriimonadaceae bacterium]
MELRGGSKRYPPAGNFSQDAFLTFADLIELLYVREFRARDVPLADIRDANLKYRNEWGVDYPFATKRFATSGRDLLIKEQEIWKNCLTGQQVLPMESFTKQLVHEGDFVTEWRPLGTERSVLLSPDRAFGQPIEDKSGVRTITLHNAVLAGDSPEEVALWYETSPASVLEAVQFEKWLSQPRVSNAVLL